MPGPSSAIETVASVPSLVIVTVTVDAVADRSCQGGQVAPIEVFFGLRKVVDDKSDPGLEPAEAFGPVGDSSFKPYLGVSY